MHKLIGVICTGAAHVPLSASCKMASDHVGHGESLTEILLDLAQGGTPMS